MAVAFDTLAYSRRLRQAGVPEEQAEVHAEALAGPVVAVVIVGVVEERKGQPLLHTGLRKGQRGRLPVVVESSADSRRLEHPGQRRGTRRRSDTRDCRDTSANGPFNARRSRVFDGGDYADCGTHP